MINFYYESFFQNKIFLKLFFYTIFSPHRYFSSQDDPTCEKNELTSNLCQTSSQSHGHRQISITSITSNTSAIRHDDLIESTVRLRTSKSLPNVFEGKKHSLNEMGTQTEPCEYACGHKIGESSEEFDDTSSSSNNAYQATSDCSLERNLIDLRHIHAKKKNLVLKHQLTRDSGIDSDTNLQHRVVGVESQQADKDLSADTEKKTATTSIDELASLNLTCTKRQLSVLKSHVIKTSFSSTRDNSMDQDFGEVNSASLDDLNENENASTNSQEIIKLDESFDEASNNAINRRQLFKSILTRESELG